MLVTFTVDTGDATLDLAADGVVDADRGRLRQRFENCFHNSVEHGPTTATERSGAAGGAPGAAASVDAGLTVTVGDRPDGFYVADDGAGIPECERDDVFELGYTTATDGTGFGLGIVADIVDAHDWSITVTDGPDGGARFEITGIDVSDG